MGAKFVAEEGNLKGLVLSLDEGEQWVIGRDPDECQLLVEDPAASRKHLICKTTEEGIVVQNLSETNPALLNDETFEEPRLLKQGDAVKIGDGLFRFYEEEGAHIINEIPETGDEMQEEEKIIDEEEEPHESVYEEEASEDKGVLAEIDFDLRETGRWLLKVIGGPNNGAEFSMQAGQSYTIGTDPNTCDVVFHDTSVSRQHARISVSEGEKLTIEDLKSRNGTLVDGEPIDGSHTLETNTLVTMGTTSFIVFDREGEMQTIISPLLPSIVKVLQREEEKDEKELPEEIAEAAKAHATEVTREEKAQTAIGAFILIGIITGLFVIVGIGTTTLFQSEPARVTQEYDTAAELQRALSGFPNVTYTYNDARGTLLLVGHVLTKTQKNQLVYNLQGLPFLRNIDDDGLVIDENVWRETNSVLNRRPQWKGINIHSPRPGKFVISGYLQTRKEKEDLSDYINTIFLYTDLLEWRIIVEEDVIGQVETDLNNAGIRNLNVAMSNGEITLTGGVEQEKFDSLDQLVRTFRNIPGVRNVKSYVSSVAPEQAMVNISNRYQVTGVSKRGGINLHVVIKGRILSRGDNLDGMTITSIKSDYVLLERDGVTYRIDYSK